jgi:hypothetical protein
VLLSGTSWKWQAQALLATCLHAQKRLLLLLLLLRQCQRLLLLGW